jgi:SAM-dependent methyltransferase
MTSQPRLSWTVDQLDVRPARHVLEIGCGHGIAAALVLDRLTSGHYVGLDRSASMVAASERRNQAAVESGRARFVCSAFADADLGAHRFDRVFAARVAAMAALPGLAFAARHLEPGGVLLLSFDSPDEARSRALATAASASLRSVGFGPPQVATSGVDGHLVACISAAAPAGQTPAAPGGRHARGR